MCSSMVLEKNQFEYHPYNKSADEHLDKHHLKKKVQIELPASRAFWPLFQCTPEPLLGSSTIVSWPNAVETE